MGECVLSNQAFRPQLVHELHEVLVALIGQVVLHGALIGVHSQAGVGAQGNAFGAQEEVGIKAFESIGSWLVEVQGNLISNTVAIGVLGLECLEHCLEFIPRGGNCQAQLVKPCLVNEHVATGIGRERNGGTTHAEDLVLGVGRNDPRVGFCIEHLLHVRQVAQFRSEVHEQRAKFCHIA